MRQQLSLSELQPDTRRLVLGWFEQVSGSIPYYLEGEDYQLAERLYREAGREVPKSVRDKLKRCQPKAK